MAKAKTQLEGKVALVTGASSGIGVAIAKSLAEAEVKVVAAARRVEKMNELFQGCRASVHPISVNLRSESAIHSMFDGVCERFGGVDILINNAGLGYAGNLQTGGVANWREMFDVNVIALALLSQRAFQDMIKRRADGHIVHLSSLSGFRVMAHESGMYAATKHAVVAIAEAQRRELQLLGSKIRVTMVSPGFVRTGFHETYFSDSKKAEELYDREAALMPEDVAEAVMHALRTPMHVAVHDIQLRSRYQQN